MSDYQKYKESHLKAQKKYDDKNREKKREYDKKRWQERKAKYQELEQLQQENQKYKEVIDKAIKYIDYSTKYRNGADIYQFVDIESEILEPLKFILELDEENGNAYLKEFKDWLKEVE